MLNEKLCEKQAKRLESNSEADIMTLRRVFMKFFTTSKLDLDIIVTDVDKRFSSLQSKFRVNLIKDSKSKHSDFQ